MTRVPTYDRDSLGDFIAHLRRRMDDIDRGRVLTRPGEYSQVVRTIEAAEQFRRGASRR
jgi:hypothetical protein